MSQLLDTAQARKQARQVLTECLHDLTRIASAPDPVLTLIMENGAPERFRNHPPDEYLIEGAVATEISPRMKRNAIRRTLQLLETFSFEQLLLFQPEKPETEQGSLF